MYGNYFFMCMYLNCLVYFCYVRYEIFWMIKDDVEFWLFLVYYKFVLSDV